MGVKCGGGHKQLHAIMGARPHCVFRSLNTVVKRSSLTLTEVTEVQEYCNNKKYAYIWTLRYAVHVDIGPS